MWNFGWKSDFVKFCLGSHCLPLLLCTWTVSLEYWQSIAGTIWHVDDRILRCGRHIRCRYISVLCQQHKTPGSVLLRFSILRFPNDKSSFQSFKVLAAFIVLSRIMPSRLRQAIRTRQVMVISDIFLCMFRQSRSMG